MKKMAAIILAAGKGTRMKSKLPKVLHELGGLPMIRYPLNLAQAFHCQPLVMVVGHEAKTLQSQIQSLSRVPKIKYALQKEQLGSAHAVLAAESELKGFKGDVLILSGDVPLLREETLKQFIAAHRASENALTLGTFYAEDPTGYGRVVRGNYQEVLKVVEQTDLNDAEREIQEVNGGLYLVQAPLLFEALKKVQKNPVKKEYYFTDLPCLLGGMGHAVGGFLIEDSSELLGVNSRWELAQAEQILQARLKRNFALSGVSFLAPHRTTLHSTVSIQADTLLHPDVSLLGHTQVGKECVLEQGVILKNVLLKDGVVVKAYSYLEDCVVESQASVGPFAHLRPGTHVGKKAKVGNFVELKKTWLGEGSKANHLSYLGDARIGKNVNIGAGTITCNYDGKKKSLTHIEDGVFIGSDTQLVAPVKVAKNAYVGAGTTITQNVPAGALAVSRMAQKNILGYSKKK